MRFKIQSVFKMHFEENYCYSNSPKMDEINGSIRHLDKLFKEAIGKGIELVYYHFHVPLFQTVNRGAGLVLKGGGKNF